MSTSRVRAVFLLGATLLIGAVVGAAAMMYAGKSGKGPYPRNRCEVRHQRVCMWAEGLQLTVDQQEQLLEVYQAGEARMDSIQRTIRPAVDSLYQTIRPLVDSQRLQLRDEVRVLLTTPQREKYDSTVNSWDEQRRQGARDRSQQGPPGPSGGPPRGRP